MAAPTAVLTHGTTSTLTLGPEPRIIRRADGFDEGQFTFHLGTEESLLPGTVVPGYSGMYVQEDSITDYSGDLEHSVRAIGLRSGAQRKIATNAIDAEEGFDTGSETWIASPIGSPFAIGRAHQDHAGLYCVNISARSSGVSQYKLYDLQFKGIKNFARPPKYKFSTSAKEIVLENFTNSFNGGDRTTPHRWSIMKGEPTLEKSYLSTSPPNYALVGTQANFTVPIPTMPAQNWSYTDTALTWQWPNQIVLVSVNAEQVLNKNCYHITETYVRRDKVTA